MNAPDAVVVGSGPNGLAAAIELARAGHPVTLLERAAAVGGGIRSAERTLPGFIHDVCSAIHPFGRTSPFFAELDLARHGLRWVESPYSVGHPLDDGTAVLVERDLEATAARLGPDADAYRRTFEPLVRAWPELQRDILAPFHVPLWPPRAVRLARFGWPAIQSTARLARRFRDDRARALVAGAGAHSILSLTEPISGAAALVMLGSAHVDGWPFPEGGTGRLAEALAAELVASGGRIETDRPVERMGDLPPHRVALFDVAPRRSRRLPRDRLPDRFRRRLERYRYGPGVFKIDVAIEGPIPWQAEGLDQAATVHVGGSFEEIARSEGQSRPDGIPSNPFVLLAQQSLFDPTRAPAGRHTVWAYCHVPNGSTVDMTEPILAQIERFAPGFASGSWRFRRSRPRSSRRTTPTTWVATSPAAGSTWVSCSLAQASACSTRTRRPIPGSSCARPRRRRVEACTAWPAGTLPGPRFGGSARSATTGTPGGFTVNGRGIGTDALAGTVGPFHRYPHDARPPSIHATASGHEPERRTDPSLPGRLPRTLGALALALAFLVPAALPAAAREPQRPLPNYHPDFITQRERGGTTADCLWASASMLVEKWTAGRITVSKDRLRRLSGDKVKGSNFKDLAPVLRHLGLKARWSPEGGEFVTWNEMRARIRAGGGAVLLGDYHELPRWYGRWAPKFWKKKGKKDNHAIYLDRYDGRTDQFWVMDPLAPAGWKGEWIPARYLRAFAWQTGGGGLWVMMTPTAKRAPFSGVKIARPRRPFGTVSCWSTGRSARPRSTGSCPSQGQDAGGTHQEPAALGITDWMSTLVGEHAAKKRKPTARYAQKTIRARMSTPAKPGAYQIALSLADRRFGRTAARSSTVVYVPGRRRGLIIVKQPEAVIGGKAFDLDATVLNTGSVDWADPEWLSPSTAKALGPRRKTTVRALWHLLEPDDRDAERAGAVPEDLLAVPLKPGAVTHGQLTVSAPNVPGRWVLTLDLADEVEGSFAAGGSAPRTMVIRIIEGRPRTDPGD
jgi:phytoene dehydrogenase-like protein